MWLILWILVHASHHLHIEAFILHGIGPKHGVQLRDAMWCDGAACITTVCRVLTTEQQCTTVQHNVGTIGEEGKMLSVHCEHNTATHHRPSILTSEGLSPSTFFHSICTHYPCLLLDKLLLYLPFLSFLWFIFNSLSDSTINKSYTLTELYYNITSQICRIDSTWKF